MSIALATRWTRRAVGHARQRDDQRHAHVLVVDEQRVTEIAVVLAERFAVVAEDHEQRVVEQAARGEPGHEIAERLVAVAQRVLVRAELAGVVKRAGLGRRVRMMAGDRHVGREEALAGRQAIDPRQHPAHGRRLVHAEAGVHVPADRAGVLGRVETLRGDDRVHAEIGKAAGVKQRRAIARRAEHARKRRRGGRHMRFGRDVERRVARLERRHHALDALRIRGVRVIEHQRALGKRRQVAASDRRPRRTRAGTAPPSTRARR